MLLFNLKVPGPLSFEFDKSFIEIARWSVYLINAGLISHELINGLISGCIRKKINPTSFSVIMFSFPCKLF
jgi:hypothetical protein